MTDTLLAEDSSNYKLVPRVHRIAKCLKDETNHHKCLILLLDLLMHESGYFASVSLNDSTPIISLWQSDNVLQIPEQFRPNEDGIYQIIYRISALADAVCKLVAIPLGDVLMVNLIPLSNGIKNRVIPLHTLKYVNCSSQEVDGYFINIKDLSHRIKDFLLTPVRCEYLTEANQINPSLAGLPEEIIIYIMQFLGKKELALLSMCSKQFLELSKCLHRRHR